jgi:hypothetical protein
MRARKGSTMTIIQKYEHPIPVFHREDGPAVIREDGTEQWWLYGEKHRIGGPAVISLTGYQEYWVFGKLQRKSGIVMDCYIGKMAPLLLYSTVSWNGG